MAALEFVMQMSFYHWLTLAAVLFIAEIVLPGGFFIGAAMGALLSAVIQFVWPDIPWQGGLIVYAVSAVSFSVLMVTKMRKMLDYQADHPELNNRLKALMGASGTIVMPNNGPAKVKIGDTLWGLAQSEHLYHQAEVRVVALVGSDLMCELIDDQRRKNVAEEKAKSEYDSLLNASNNQL